MKALSVRQPWAWLIYKGYKDVENRDWPTNFKGRTYIHSGRKWESNAMDFIRPHVKPEIASYVCQLWELTLGAIIGEVDITDCVEHSDSPWFVGQYGFTLANPVLYETPIPCRGKLGFFIPVIPEDK